MKQQWIVQILIVSVVVWPTRALGEGDWEITPDSERAVKRGLEWLARNQGPAGNWGSNDLGLVALGALAFMSAGHMPDRGKYGKVVRRAINYLLTNAKPSGLLNIASGRRDNYNHGLSVFVLSQAYGMTKDRRISKVMEKGIKLILDVQCKDGGWRYEAHRSGNGADLSLAVMQAKALRAAMDMGLEIPKRDVVEALSFIRKRYKPSGGPDGKNYGSTDPLAKRPGAFTYNGNKSTTAMAAAGAVCLQEFGEYKDFRIKRSMDRVVKDIRTKMRIRKGHMPFDAYTMYYVGQGLYQIGGRWWKDHYGLIRDAVIKTQNTSNTRTEYGSWNTERVGGVPGKLFGTAVGVFVLSIPNRYLPILQKGEDKGTATGRLNRSKMPYTKVIPRTAVALGVAGKEGVHREE